MISTSPPRPRTVLKPGGRFVSCVPLMYKSTPVRITVSAKRCPERRPICGNGLPCTTMHAESEALLKMALAKTASLQMAKSGRGPEPVPSGHAA